MVYLIISNWVSWQLLLFHPLVCLHVSPQPNDFVMVSSSKVSDHEEMVTSSKVSDHEEIYDLGRDVQMNKEGFSSFQKKGDKRDCVT